MSRLPPAQRSGDMRTGLARILVLALTLAACPVTQAQDRVRSDEPAQQAAPSLNGTPPRLPTAKRYLDEAKRRLAGQLAAKFEAKSEEQRRQAQEAALGMAREKLKSQSRRDAEAKQQLQVARERQLKTLYQQGQALYQQGRYDEAIGVLENMTLLAPDHPVVKAAQRLIARAELKRFELRLRVSAEVPQQMKGAVVSELEQLLSQKRMELETVFKYAKAAIQQEQYDTAIRLLTAVLVQDPMHRPARQLLEQAQLSKLEQQEEALTREINQDERAMINDVLKAQVLPETPSILVPRPVSLPPGAAPMISAKLREPISFEFNDVALSDVLEFLGDAANVSIIPSPQLDLKTQRVSLKVKDLPLEDAVKYLAKSLALAYRIDQDAILLASAEEFSNEPLETRVFFLRNGLGPFALETAALEPNSVMAMDSIKALIEQSIPQAPDSKLVVDQRSGALIVTNTAEHLKQMERLLNQLDVAPIQVLIEARFIEVSETELNEMALEAVLTGAASLKTKPQDNGSTRGPSHQIASGGGFKFPALAREEEGVNLTLEGILTGTQFEAVLHLLDEAQTSKTLSAPRVTTLNNQTALIRVVDEFRYPTRYEVSLIQFDINGDGDFDDAGETEFANVPQDLQKRDVGILMNVTPSVGKDLRTITLVLAPEVSKFSRFRDLGGGVTVPEFTSSQLTTSVAIEDGQTVMLGGLMKDTSTEVVSKVPLLGDLPVVGGLFRQREQETARSNLLIFITARIIGSRGPTT